MKSGAYEPFGNFNNKLLSYEDGKFYTYDVGKTNREEISEKEFEKMLEGKN